MPSADWCSSKSLLVLLRGTAFRGNHHNAAEEQRESLQSIHTHLLQRAISLGWKPAVLADVVVPDGGCIEIQYRAQRSVTIYWQIAPH